MSVEEKHKEKHALTRPFKRKLAIGVTAGVVALGAVGGIGSAAFADSGTTTPSTSSTQSASPSTQTPQSQGAQKGTHGARGDHGFGGEKLAQELATKLGVDQTKVQDALKAFAQAHKPTKPADGTKPNAGQRPDPSALNQELAQSLAKSLGLDESKVSDALNAIQSEHKAAMEARLKEKLDAAVKAGKITQADEDSYLKVTNLGIVGGPQA